MSRILSALLFLMFAVACGEPTDRPEDCTPNEYFDESRRLCRVCPAPSAPQCDPGCGIRIVEDQRGCPATECLVGEVCSDCGPLEFVDPDTLICTPCDGPMSCEDGSEPERWLSETTCSLRCP